VLYYFELQFPERLKRGCHMDHFARVIVEKVPDSIAIWESRGSRKGDFEVFYIDRERDGMTPYQRRQRLAATDRPN
jgi:hypothetical protein